jgi:hypothetical protein
MITNVYGVGGGFGETLGYESQEIRFVNLKDFVIVV